MGRPKKESIQQRVELKLPKDEMLTRLELEARLRGVTIQQHMFDILRARWLAQQGTPIDLAGETTATAVTDDSTSEHYATRRAA
jgi:hypothetical protein